jgi:hypothetical protein
VRQVGHRLRGRDTIIIIITITIITTTTIIIIDQGLPR